MFRGHFKLKIFQFLDVIWCYTYFPFLNTIKVKSILIYLNFSTSFGKLNCEPVEYVKPHCAENFYFTSLNS